MGEVWIVEDDEFYQNFLTVYLNTTGYKTRSFKSGEECIRHLHEKPWAILLDHDLGSPLNGTDILRIIKEHDENIPVITVSGAERAEIAAEAFRSGSEDYIRKDSASLIRLKLMLERLRKADEERARQKLTRRRIRNILIAVAVAVAAATTVWMLAG